MKSTAIAPSNIAFVKYWGKRDEMLRIPTNGSISMNLSNLTTTTTVEFSDTLKMDEVIIDGQSQQMEVERVSQHLDIIRKLAGIDSKVRVVSNNNFPSRTGLSSSASGFAALTLAACSAAGLKLSQKKLSILARLSSGSACRSIPSGFVEWIAGNSHETSFAHSVFPPDHWDIIDVVAVVSKAAKTVSTSEGQQRTQGNPFFRVRVSTIDEKLAHCKNLIKEKNFHQFGELVEKEALELHAVMMTSNPPLLYLTPETVLLINLVWQWRNDGLPVYFTLNTGQDVHLISEEKNQESLVKQVRKLEIVKQVIVNKPCDGAELVGKHLF